MAERYTSYSRPVLWLVPEREESPAIAPFYLSTLPVTNRQLEACGGERRRPVWSPGDDDPAIGVPVELAREYCAWYARIARKAIRLPTEAEWDYACRAGVEGEWWREGSIDTWVWHGANSGGGRIPALDAKRTNPFGLHAMVGGVWEWVVGEDGPVLRGGSWRTPPDELGCGLRREPTPELVAEAGFRIARSLRS
jgi:formylglycine-generating enzyme required for sulfatase activity